MRIIKNRSVRVMGMAMVSALFAALLVPMAASALTISGTVQVTGGSVSTHPIYVQLFEDDGAGGWMFTEYGTQTIDGTWSIDVGTYTPPGDGKFKVVFDDQPYNWYEQTVYPNVTVVNDDYSGGTSVAPGASGLAATMKMLAQSFVGKVVDSKSGAGIGDITVTAYEYLGGAWVDSGFSTTTDASGNYQLRGLKAGTYRLKFEDYNGQYADTFPATNQTAPNLALPNQAMTHTVNVERIAPTSGNFWTQPVNVAKRQYLDPVTLVPNYEDVKDVVIASGDTRAQADPLAAAGLCWAYQVTDDTSFNAFMNAPLLLVSSARTTDSSVLKLVSDIANSNGGLPVTVHIVGGTGSVPDARFNEIKAYVLAHAANGAKTPVKDRIASTGDRFTLARDIAARMKLRTTQAPILQLPGFVLVANGADSAKFFDPLALSPIAAATGAPILLVSANAVPSATYSAISTVKPTKIYVGGGSGTVSNTVLALLKPKATYGSTRIWGADRYLNAIAIANYAISKGWLYDDGSVGVASTITDAQLGGVLAGNEAAPLLVNAPTSLNSNTSKWLTSKKGILNRVYVVGSTSSISSSTYNAIKAAVAN